MYLIQHDQLERTGRVAYLYIMSKDERALLPVYNDECLSVEIEDRTTGKTYAIRNYFCNIDDEVATGETVLRSTLDWYMYYWHFCACKREYYIQNQYANEPASPQVECGHGRYLIKSITHPALPNVNLYREEWVTDRIPDNYSIIE